MAGCDDIGRYEDLVIPPAPLRQSAKRRPPTSLGVWLRMGVIAFGAALVLPLEARAAAAGAESVPIVVWVAGLGLALSFLVAVAAAVTTLLRRSRDAANEARRLNALLDMLDEGVAGCPRM